MIMRYDIEKVIRARLIAGWTQAKLAKRIDRDPSTICAIENGRFEPSPTTMKRIAEELGLDMEDLVLEECTK
jgi:DNA-binding XRE family transcriptional regulator